MNETKKLITCVLPKGTASVLLRKLKDEKEIIVSNINNARGRGRFTRRSEQRLGDVVEKEILNIVTSAEEADEIFEFIFYEADVNRPHGGIIFMTKLDRATDSLLPDLPEEGI